MSDIGDRFIKTRTVALIGASEREGAIGRTITENLLRSKNRKVYAVNPGRERVLDIPCYSAISDIPEPVDIAIIATPAHTVPKIVDECGKKGVKGLIIISAGFKEAGEEGQKLEDEIKTIRRQYDMRIIGPNCMGLIIPGVDLNASFATIVPRPGKIAFISQSGALGSVILDWAVSVNIGFSLFASLGSMVDVDFGDLIDWLGDDPETKSILIYMEGVQNAKKFMSAARSFAWNKPIIVLKPGRFPESARAASSHTGAMAGEDEVYDGAFKRVGVVRVREIADLFNAAQVLGSRHLPVGPNVAIITNAGGPGVMATDVLIEQGGRLARLSSKSMQALNSFLPGYWSKANPLDILSDADAGRYQKTLSICLEDSAVDGVIVTCAPQDGASSIQTAEHVIDSIKSTPKPVLTSWMGAAFAEGARRVFAQNGIPTYETPEDALRAYFYMDRYRKNLELIYETPADLPVELAPPTHHLKAVIRRALKEGRTLLTEEESKSFLSNYGIPANTTHTAVSLSTAATEARKVGYPVVLKIVSPDITHKSDVGGVITGIASDEALTQAYNGMMQQVSKNAPGARIEGVSVQAMMEGVDYEIILGAKKDKDFGSVVLFGSGGVGAELFRDFSIGLPPLNQTLARRLMEETIVYQLLQGYRGKPRADIEQLEQTIVGFSNLVVDFPEIAEVDVNPLAVSNGKVCALDARIIIDREALGQAEPYPHLVITPYPTKYVQPWRLKDGTQVLLRPIRPEDEPFEYEMLSALSGKTLGSRFFIPVKEIDHQVLRRFCNIDYDREMTIVAQIGAGENRTIIGVARYFTEPRTNSGEFAVLVRDEYQGEGLGRKLIDAILGIAADKGLEEIHGIVSKDDEILLGIARSLGFVSTWESDELTKISLTLK